MAAEHELSKEGAGVKKKVYIILCLAMIFLFAACGNEKELKADIIDFENVDISEAEYNISRVEKVDLIQQIKVERLQLLPKNAKTIYAKYPVMIKEYARNISEMINKGELIIELTSKELNREIRLKEFMVQQDKLVLDSIRNSGKSEMDVKIQEAKMKISEEELRKLIDDRENLKIYAETDCYVTAGDFAVGKKFKPGDQICEINDATEHIIHTLEVNFKDYKNMNIGDIMHFCFLDKNTGRTIKKDEYYEAKVSFISKNQANQGKIYFELLNKDALGSIKHSDFKISGTIRSIILKDVLVIPQSAVKIGSKTYVEVMKDGIRRIRYIQTGARGSTEEGKYVFGGAVQVVEGLREGEIVIRGPKKE